MNTIPDIVTHNYDPEGVFLGNLCEQAPPDAEKVLDRIRKSGRRTIKENYLSRRLATEAWLISERRRLLGRTPRERPIYFFLGDFADGKDPSRPCSLVMPLGAFPPHVLTFTYPDSMASFLIAAGDGQQPERRPYHGRLFTLPQLKCVVEEFGIPGERWKTDSSRRFDRFIEVQVWDDRPIRELLSRSG
jgi:hypothetical protein